MSVFVMGGVPAGFAAAGLGPLTNLSTWLTGLGAFGILTLITATSVSVLVFFLRRRENGWRLHRRSRAGHARTRLGHRAGAGQLRRHHGHDVVGHQLPAVDLAGVVLVGVAVAATARRRDPARYAAMGETQMAE